jgi:hypothetical protein
MKKNLKQSGTKFFAPILVIFLLTLSLSVFSQNQEIDPDRDPDNPSVPLDGGLSLLLAAGVAYGGKKVADYRKRNKNDHK